MNAKISGNEELMMVIKEFINHSVRREESQTAQQERQAGQLDKLVDSQANMNEKIASLTTVLGKSEERNSSTRDSVSRIGNSQAKSDKESNIYKKNNDDRVMALEKQVLLLDNSNNTTKARFNKFDKIGLSVITTVISLIIVVYLGLK